MTKVEEVLRVNNGKRSESWYHYSGANDCNITCFVPGGCETAYTRVDSIAAP